MTRRETRRRARAGLAPLVCLPLSFFLTGCPLSDRYVLQSDAIGGTGAGDDGGASALGATGGSSALGGAPQGGAPSSRTGGSSGAGAALPDESGAPDSGGEAGQGPAGGTAALAGNAGSSGSPGSSGSSGTSGSSGSLGVSGASGMSATSGDSGSSGAGGSAGFSGGAGTGPTCSALTCSYTCCAASGGAPAASCVDTTRDFTNCGACGTLCDVGRSCTSSACTPGWVSASAAPTGFAARWRAASVSMGKSVFIWGGSDSSGAVLDSGAIYSPMTDGWTLLPKDASTPTARVLASAVWTGSVVIVYGGSDATGASVYKDAALYDPAKNAWTSLPAAGKARSSALGFWDGNRAIFWGGIGATGAVVAGADRFDLTSWAASSLNGDPGALSGPALGWDGATLYLEGGQLSGTRTDKVYSYTSSTDTWLSLSKSLSARSNAFGVWDGMHFLVWGGRDDNMLRNDGKYQSGMTWSTMSVQGAPSARMAVLRRSGWIFQTSPGVVALFGGQSSLNGQNTFATTGATYEVSNAKWTSVPSWPSGEMHDYGVGVWTGTEFVLWGGRDGATPTPTLTGERWKP